MILSVKFYSNISGKSQPGSKTIMNNLICVPLFLRKFALIASLFKNFRKI